jgi:5-methyltetrahydropteroyltriglutamate--homocysteine methyltransferase
LIVFKRNKLANVRHWQQLILPFRGTGRIAAELRQRHWRLQARSGLDFIPVGDFSYYDQVLDTSVMLGVIPERFGSEIGLDTYFRMPRGQANAGQPYLA